MSPVEVFLDGSSRGILGPGYSQLNLEGPMTVTWSGDEHAKAYVNYGPDATPLPVLDLDGVDETKLEVSEEVLARSLFQTAKPDHTLLIKWVKPMTSKK